MNDAPGILIEIWRPSATSVSQEIARAAVEKIIAWPAEERVVARAAEEAVIAHARSDHRRRFLSPLPRCRRAHVHRDIFNEVANAFPFAEDYGSCSWSNDAYSSNRSAAVFVMNLPR